MANDTYTSASDVQMLEAFLFYRFQRQFFLLNIQSA